MPCARHFLTAAIDVPKLRVAVGVVRALLGLAIALQAIVQIVKNLRDLHMTNTVFVPAKFLGNRPRTLAYPSQGRLRIASRLTLNHLFQCLHQPRVGNCDGLAPGTGPANATFSWHAPFLDFANTFGDRLA